MKKNVASQVIGAQMIAAADGSAFTAAVVVYVTVDGGTQAVGSVSAGACAHEGNGFHSYAPSQAESNGDHLAFTFIGTGAVPATVQVYTTFPQTGDNFARLGAPAGASVSADVAAVKTQTAAIEIDTGEIGAAGAGLTGLASAANLATVAGYIDTEVAAIKAKTDNLPADPADASDIAAALATVPDLVWDEALAGHVTAGSAGAQLSAAGAGGDPWSTALPGGYSAGQAGFMLDAIKDYADRTVIRGTVGATSPGTTSMTPSAISPAGVAADQFKGRILIFDNDTTTTSLRGQATDITASSAAGLPLLTYSALSNAPASGDTFSIV
ncbi:MAG: hypothetical protein ABI624_10625 [Casimicrobiaceae bacterium]